MQLAIGDIHGCRKALETLLEAIAPSSEDLIVTLGDYVDRGPDSRGVIETLLALQDSHQVISLIGNHEVQMIRALETKPDRERFLSGMCGGQDTLDSYGGRFSDVPESHWNFMRNCQLFHELPQHILVHAGLEAHLTLEEQDRETYYYQRFHHQKPHCSGKTVVCGHTIQGDLPTNQGHAICLDTCAYGGGWLTALDIESDQIWQSNEKGESRKFHLADL